MPRPRNDDAAAEEVLCAADAVDIETAINHVSSNTPACNSFFFFAWEQSVSKPSRNDEEKQTPHLVLLFLTPNTNSSPWTAAVA